MDTQPTDSIPKTTLRTSASNSMIRRIGIVAAILFLLVSGLVFLFASVAPGYMGAELQRQIKGHPVIQAEFGDLKSCSMSYSATVSNGNPDVILFDVEGTKDKGQLIVEQITSKQTTFNTETMIIRKYDGREIPLSNKPPKSDSPSSELPANTTPKLP